MPRGLLLGGGGEMGGFGIDRYITLMQQIQIEKLARNFTHERKSRTFVSEVRSVAFF